MFAGPNTATGTPSALITTREARQRVLDAQFDFVRKSLKIALRSARANGEELSAWAVLTDSGTFDPRNYLPTERYRIRLTWSVIRQDLPLDRLGPDVTPEQLLSAARLEIPDLSEFTVTDYDNHEWSLDEDVERTVTTEVRAYGDVEIRFRFDFTASYVGSLMDGGVTPNTVERSLTRHRVGGYMRVDSVMALPVEPLTPPVYAPGPGDSEPRYTEAQVQQQVDDAIAILQREMGEVGMDGKRAWGWCSVAEATLSEIGVPGFYDEDACDCENCRGDEEGDEDSDIWVDFTVTRTIRVRARRTDSGELPDDSWVQASIRNRTPDVEMDRDWDDVEVLSVSDSVSDVSPLN